MWGDDDDAPRLIVAALLAAALAPATAQASTAVADPLIFGAGRVDAVETGGALYRCTSTVLTETSSGAARDPERR